MTEAYLTSFLSDHQGDPRDHFHDVALHEARIASEVHARPADPARTAGLVQRVRAALTGAARVERCDCPAAA
jgi:hypothetical protein